MDPENVFQEFVMPDPVEQVDGYPQCAPFARISQVKPKENLNTVKTLDRKPPDVQKNPTEPPVGLAPPAYVTWQINLLHK
jgi:hypothetical protein